MDTDNGASAPDGKPQTDPSSLQALLRDGRFLLAVGLVTTAMLAATNELTRDRIADQERAARQAVLLELIDAPASYYDNEPLDDSFEIAAASLGYDEPRRAYRMRRGGEVRLLILPVVAPDGYSGAIDLLVGVASDGRISGARVTKHRETPGLGDKVELRKSPWILGFDDKSLNDPPPARWTVRRDGGAFDQFTGATVTPRAVISAIRRVLEYVELRRGDLFENDARSRASES